MNLPKVIHRIIGRKQSPLVKACLVSWNKLKRKEYSIVTWTDELIEVFLRTHYPTILIPFLDARNHAEAADIARYAIVYHYGGHYLDWDVELSDEKKFLELCERCPTGYLLQDPKNLTLSSEAFSALPQEPYLWSLLQSITELHSAAEHLSMKTPQYTGPYRMREVYESSAYKSMQKIVPIKEAFLYDYDEIRQMKNLAYTTPMIHYWVHSWIFDE